MKALIVGYCFSGFFVLLPLIAVPFQRRRFPTLDEKRARSVRRIAESGRGAYFLTAWMILTAIGSIILIVRGHEIGWGWLGVSAMWGLGIVLGRWSDRRVLRLLSDRGRIERTKEYQTQENRMKYFGLASVVGIVGTGVLRYIYPGDDAPTPAAAAIVLLTVVLGVGAIGYLVTITKMSRSD